MSTHSSNSDSGRSVQLSILIVTFNSGETIDVCLKSIVGELADIRGEVILVDNNSSDATPQIISNWSQKDNRIISIMTQSNRGFSAGNNLALEQASGEYILILNPDTELWPGSLNRLLTTLKENDHVGIVAPRLVFPDGRTQMSCRRFPRHRDVVYHTLGLDKVFSASAHFNAWKMGDFNHDASRQVDQPAGAALLIRGQLIRELGGFDENFPMFFNDVELCWQVKAQGYEIWYDWEAVVTHSGGASVRQVKAKMILSSHVSFFRFFEKHYTRIHQQPINFVVGVLLYLSLIPRLMAAAIFRGRGKKTRDIL